MIQSSQEILTVMDLDFSLPEDDNVETGLDECPTCGVLVSIDGPTPGCDDEDGCAESLDESDDEDLEDEEEMDEYDDEEVQELDFE